MSAANDFLKNNPILGTILSIVGSLIVVFVTFGLSKGDLNEREIKQKLDTKAEYEYVDKEIVKVKELQNAELNGIRKSVDETREDVKIIKEYILKQK